ncbi:lipase [Tritrichomonas foetus]|uniref:sn-1-specific diacylglycerol lipase n=1 Tax=Tritrichomonas foetus TaxID=1144522 RepID=A0A1J4K7B0_9EUKA|nr:lipase [Tritrichomonas foetus]|eukprot:OHT07271.1 lipase [Tritrichomonas foetus]
MFRKVTSFLGYAKDTVKDGFNKVLGSHEVVRNALVAKNIVSSPTSFTFAYFMNKIINTLSPPDETDDGNNDFTSEELNLIQICAKLASDVYLEAGERTLPKEAGELIYEPTLTNSSAVPFAIMNSDELNMIFVSCRGSYCFRDFFTDFNANAVDAFDGLMHSGVLKAALSVYAICKDLIIQVSQQNGNRPVIFTGHSLGAAVAATVSEILKQDFPDFPARSIVFAPAACISRDLWQKSREHCLSFVMSGDFVPFLSFHNIAAYSSEYLPDFIKNYIDDLVRREVSRPTKEVEIDMTSNPFEKPPPTLEEVYLELNNESGYRTTALFPPGELYLLDLSGDIFKSVDLRKIRSCEYFGRFIPGLEEFNHSMDIYAECINKIYLTQVEKEKNEEQNLSQNKIGC